MKDTTIQHHNVTVTNRYEQTKAGGKIKRTIVAVAAIAIATTIINHHASVQDDDDHTSVQDDDDDDDDDDGYLHTIMLVVNKN